MNELSHLIGLGGALSKKIAFFPVISISVFAFFVVLYNWQSVIPPDLYSASGVLSVKKIGKTSYLSVDDPKQGPMNFTCADMLAGFSECLPRRQLPELLGQHATIRWYSNDYFPMVSDKKLVTLEVGDQKIITEEMSRQRLEESKTLAAWLYGCGVLFAGCISALLYWLLGRK